MIRVDTLWLATEPMEMRAGSHGRFRHHRLNWGHITSPSKVSLRRPGAPSMQNLLVYRIREGIMAGDVPAATDAADLGAIQAWDGA